MWLFGVFHFLIIITKQTVFRLDFKWNNNSFTVNSLHLQSIWGVMLHLLSRLPFEWRTLRTYLLVATMQCIVVTYLFHLMGGLITFGIGTFVFAVKAVTEVGRGLKLLNGILKSKTDVQHSMKCIRISVHYHAILKELSIFWVPVRNELQFKSIVITSSLPDLPASLVIGFNRYLWPVSCGQL